MIKALRLTLSSNVPYEHVKVYSSFLGDDMSNYPNFFEDSQINFMCKNGQFTAPDYNVVLIQIHNNRVRAPEGSILVKRILLYNDLNYQSCGIVQQQDYQRLGIPQIFREYEQMSFVCNDGLMITTDYQVQHIQL